MDSIIRDLTHSLKEEEIYKTNRIQHKESYILRLITLAYLTDKTLRFSDLLANTEIGSSPTIQTHIAHLVQKQFVLRQVSEEDKRVHYLIPTEQAIDLFAQLS